MQLPPTLQTKKHLPDADILEKIKQRILNLEYVDIYELLPEAWQFDRVQEQHGQCCHQTKYTRRSPITSLPLWLECYATLVTVITSRYPAYVAELMAYQQTIIRTARNFKGTAWVTYDMCYRRRAARAKHLRWSSMDLELYQEAFTGWARAIPRSLLLLPQPQPCYNRVPFIPTPDSTSSKSDCSQLI